MKTLVALPVYNDGASVDGVVRGIREHLPGLDVDIISINDGSTDDTASELLKVPAIGILTHAKNMGYGAAKHMEGLATHGVTPEHRRSFAPVRKALGLSAPKKTKGWTGLIE